MRRSVLWASLVISAALPVDCASSQQMPDLPLGPANAPQQVGVSRLAAGLRLTHIVRGQADPQAGYAVDIPFNTDQPTVQRTAAALAAAGFPPQVIPIQGPSDAAPGFFGAVVRVGVYPTQDRANGMVTTLANAGFKGAVTGYTGFNGFLPTTGPWVIDVVELDPAKFKGTAQVVRPAAPQSRETVSSIAARTGALVAVNGGYFVIGSGDGPVGAPVGISVLHGQLYHEATEGRTTFAFLPGGLPLVDRFHTRAYVQSGFKPIEPVSGLDRRPGLQRDCGGPAGEQPSNQPRQDFNCTVPDDLVAFTPRFGPTTDAGPATVEVSLDEGGHILSVVDGGNVAIPPHGVVLAATGAKAAQLRSLAAAGGRLLVPGTVLTAAGKALNPQLGFFVVNGGPRLVRDGQPDIDATAEGFAYPLPGNGNEYYGFGLSRNPRTLAGRTADGHMLLVSVDGRQPGYSVGLSFDESAALMAALGAKDAVNLDGGGSTAIAVNGQLASRPSDATGERPVGEAIVIRP